MKLINRHRVAEILGMTSMAVSVQVSKRNWEAVPRPAKIGGVYKWIEEDVDNWIRDKFAERWEPALQEDMPQRKRGRPRKDMK